MRHCAALDPADFCLKSFPRQYGAGSGLAVLYRNSLSEHIAVTSRCSVLTAYKICEERVSHDSHTVVYLSVYHHQHPRIPHWHSFLSSSLQNISLQLKTA